MSSLLIDGFFFFTSRHLSLVSRFLNSLLLLSSPLLLSSFFLLLNSIPSPRHGADPCDGHAPRGVVGQGALDQALREGRHVGGGGYRSGAEAFGQARVPSRTEQVLFEDHAAQVPGREPGHALRDGAERGGHEQAAGTLEKFFFFSNLLFALALFRPRLIIVAVVDPLSPLLFFAQTKKNQKKKVGISSVWYEGNPCNMHLMDLAAEVKSGVEDAGMVGYRFNTIGVSDGISMGTDGMSFSLQSRDLIADSIETVMGAQW